MRDNKPYITYLFVAANYVVFFWLEMIGSTNDAEFMIEMGAVWPERIMENWEYWRFLTSAFLHFGISHLLANMLCLVYAGKYLESVLGHIRFFILYLCSAVGSSIVSYLHMRISGHYAVSAGASGAIFGVLAGWLWVLVLDRMLRGKLASWRVVLGLVYIIYTGIAAEEGVDNWGHVGGILTGYLLSVFLYSKKPKGVEEYEN
ncbi:MAG: rhomboid family intramembrane serine protease [Muribaculaceae bacterium]|nr:rhomboid family intramembrane serine protease [Roseburia sp.]MCM1429920.1 rhomboid family intramembrane serine protease [Muribaculaceae bacterium]MCM1493053.1 rhomboid family intramembrane serine protease [Muribaculaceae bacterium]